MKKIVFVYTVLVSISLYASAILTELPTWLTDDKAKLMAVNQLIDFMKDAEFYKIKTIKVQREYKEKNKSEGLDIVLTFDDPSCKERQVSVSTDAELCDDEGCLFFETLSACLPSSSGKNLNIFLSR